MTYDVIIIGAGAAGLTAAIYCGRKTLKTLVIAKDLGGQALLAKEMENYPGFETISGLELMKRLEVQVKKYEVETLFSQEVNDIEKKKDVFLVQSEGREYQAKSVILASGLTPRSLEVKGEKEYRGKGVAYCATCDAPFYKNKIVAVVGGGNSALDAALNLSKIAKKVYLIHRRDEFRGDEIYVEKVKKNKKIKLILNTVVKEIKGDKFVSAVVIEDVGKGVQKEIKLEGVFVEIGYETKTDFLKGFLELNERGEIVVDCQGRTSIPGIFAAGDVTIEPFKQVVISAGAGAKAALSAYQFLQGTDVVGVDWKKH